MYDVINMPDLVIRYFSSTPWLIFFLLSTVYLFIRMNTARKRGMLAAVIIFFLFVNAFVIKVFTHLGENSTFYRHLWAIPSVAIIGIAIVDLIRIVPKWYLKIPAVIVIAIGLWFINEQEYIRCRVQVFSTDTKLVPEDVVVLGDELERFRKESGKNTLFVVCPVGYERPYGNMRIELSLYSGNLNVCDSSILTDENHNGEVELSGENPDVEFIMAKCCANGMDYIIVSKALEEEYNVQGYKPAYKTESFLLYECTGYAGITQDITSHGLTSWKAWHNKDGVPVINEKGYYKVEYKYDEKDRKISERYLDITGELVNNSEGYAISTREYGKYGVTEISLYNSEEEPCVKNNHGYSIIRYIWNGKGQIEEEQYYNEKNELMNYDWSNPRAITRFKYDDKGNKISEKYYNVEDFPSKALAGYDEIRKEYDDEHRIIRLGYYIDGQLVNRNDTGYAEIRYVYNASKELEYTQYYDQNGNEVAPSF